MGQNPQRYAPAPASMMVRMPLLKVPFTGGQGGRCCQRQLGHSCGQGPVPWSQPHVHPWGPLSLTPWKTQRAQSSLGLWLECPSMECHSIDLARHWSCAGLGARSGQCGAWFLVQPEGPVPLVGSWSLLGGLSKHGHRPETMGSLRVKDITAPEVKFLDRCEINSSEGVLQVRVRRSRMRVWGAKMIRHRRSPTP